MARTESFSVQVHPNDEQSQINLMQKFHWSLQNSQEIKTVDSHLERRGDEIYSVTNSERYMKLTFSRELDLPNLKEVKELEQKYFGLSVPKYPKLFPGTIFLWLVLVLTLILSKNLLWGIGIVGWILYFALSYNPKKAEADRLHQENEETQQELLNALAKFD